MTFYEPPDPDLGPDDEEDDEQPVLARRSRCHDGMCGAEDCERCNP